MLAVVFLLYLPTVRYGLVSDDNVQIVSNYRLTSWHYFPGYFTTHLWAHDATIPGKWYRPLFLVWLRLCYVLLGSPTGSWHWGSLLAHVAATAAVYALVRKLVGDSTSAVLSAGLFGIHPIHTESVAWISAVEDPLVTAFMALCVYFYAARKRPVSVLSLLFALLAMFTKEVGVMALGLIFAYEWIHSSLKKAVVASLPYLPCAAVYFALRMTAIGKATVATRHYMHFWTMVLTWPHLLATYALHLLWPIHLSVLYDDPLETRIWPLLLLLVVLGALIWVFRKSGETIRFGMAWFAITLLPALAIWYFDHDYLHDRYLYPPSVGLVVIAAVILSRLRFTPVQVIATAAVAGILCIVTLTGLPVWHDDISLHERALELAPRDTRVMNNLALDYMAQLRYTEASRLLQRAIAIKPTDPDLYTNLGSCYQLIGDYAEASRNKEIAVELAAKLNQSGEQ